MAGSASGAASANTESSASTGASALRVSVIKGGGVQRLAVLCQRKLAQDPFAGGILIIHRRKVSDADDERSFLLYVRQIGRGVRGGGLCTGGHTGKHQHGKSQGKQLFHIRFLH